MSKNKAKEDQSKKNVQSELETGYLPLSIDAYKKIQAALHEHLPKSVYELFIDGLNSKFPRKGEKILVFSKDEMNEIIKNWNPVDNANEVENE